MALARILSSFLKGTSVAVLFASIAAFGHKIVTTIRAWSKIPWRRNPDADPVG